MAKFPDLNKDGEVTQADVLMGRGVFASGGRIVYREGGDPIGGNPTQGTPSQGQKAYEDQINKRNEFLKELEKEMNKDKEEM